MDRVEAFEKLLDSVTEGDDDRNRGLYQTICSLQSVAEEDVAKAAELRSDAERHAGKLAQLRKENEETRDKLEGERQGNRPIAKDIAFLVTTARSQREQQDNRMLEVTHQQSLETIKAQRSRLEKVENHLEVSRSEVASQGAIIALRLGLL